MLIFLTAVLLAKVVLGGRAAVEEITIVSAVSNKTDDNFKPENAIDRNFSTMYYAKDLPKTGIRGNFLLLTLAQECRVSDVKIYSTTKLANNQDNNIINTTVYAIGKSGEFNCGSIDVNDGGDDQIFMRSCQNTLASMVKLNDSDTIKTRRHKLVEVFVYGSCNFQPIPGK
eukprot:sb/3472198/